MLVSSAKSGDTDAFIELSKRNAAKVFQATYRVTGIGRMPRMRFRTVS